jgi:hypothetical protein
VLLRMQTWIESQTITRQSMLWVGVTLQRQYHVKKTGYLVMLTLAEPEAGYITPSLGRTSSSSSIIVADGLFAVARPAQLSANKVGCQGLESFEVLMGMGRLESHLTESPIVMHQVHVGSEGIDLDLDTTHLVVIGAVAIEVSKEPPVIFLESLLFEHVELCRGADEDVAKPRG